MSCPVVHFEIGCQNLEREDHFFAELFGWKMTKSGPSSLIDTEAGAGINGHINSLGHDPRNYTMIYVQVDNLQQYVDRAAMLGGRVVVPPSEIPGVGRFAWISDPEGMLVGLFTPKA